MSYFKSKDIRVFPCSYRGNYTNTKNKSIGFDPEARLTTEYNYLNAGGKLNLKDSYIVDYAETEKILKCVIGGYYFEISNLDKDDLNNQYLCIKTRSIRLNDSNDEVDSARETKVLTSWENTLSDLDILENGEYYFTGINIATNEETGSTAFLQPFIDGNINYAALLPQVFSGTDKDSIHVGETTKADKDNLVAIGTYNATEDNDLFVVGNGTETDRSNVLQVNKDKVVISKQTNITGDTTITGKITQDGSSNQVTFNGNVDVKNGLDVAGDEAISGKLELKGDFIVNTNNTNKFKVTAETGKTEIAGDLEVQTDKFKVNTENEKTTITENGDVVISGNINLENKQENESNNSSKFSVDATTGDTTILGNLTTAHITETGDNLTINETTTIKGKLTVSSADSNIFTANADEITNSVPVNCSNTLDVTGDTNMNDANVSGTINTKNLNINKYTTTEGIEKTAISFTTNNNETTIKTDDEILNFGDAVNTGLKKILLNLLYPVGSIYTSTTFATTKYNPNSNGCEIGEKLGGTWKQIKGRFLVAAGDDLVPEKPVKDQYYSNLNLAVDAEGGSKDAIVVKHTHGTEDTDGNGTTGSTTISCKEAGSSSGNFTLRRMQDGTDLITAVDGSIFTTEKVSGNNAQIDYHSKGTQQKVTLTINAHKHELTNGTHTHAIDSFGESGENANMPPYLVVYMWKRIS